VKLDYRVFVWFDGDPNAASKVDRKSGWTLMAAFYYMQEALDFAAYATKAKPPFDGRRVRLKGPAGLDRIYEPGAFERG